MNIRERMVEVAELGALVAALLLIGGLAGGIIGAVSVYTLVGAVVLAAFATVVLGYVCYFGYWLLRFLSDAVAWLVAGPRGIATGLGRTIGHSVSVLLMSSIVGLVLVGATLGALLARNIAG